jgi:hypothetical protein
MQVEPYLFFEGRCEEALTVYRVALGVEVTMLMRLWLDEPGGLARSLRQELSFLPPIPREAIPGHSGGRGGGSGAGSELDPANFGWNCVENA